MRLKANQANTTLEVRKGSVGVGFEADETTTIGTITVNYLTSITTDADVYIGDGVTLTTLAKPGGICKLGCAVTTATNDAARLLRDKVLRMDFNN